jgi:hypothetical protein
MTEIKITRPRLPKGYVDNPKGMVPWDYVVNRLSESKNYWLCSVRPDGRPHSIPRWGIFLDDRLYYDGSPETIHASNIEQNPHVSVHLENADQAIIAEGICSPSGKPDPAFAKRLAAIFGAKYTKFGYTPEPEQWDNGGLYIFTPTQVLAWTVFFEDPTKFILIHAK